MQAKQSFVYKRPLVSTNFKFKANYEIFNMPNVVIPTSLIKELGGGKVWRFLPENKHLICKLCSFSGLFNRKSVLEKHVQSARHQHNLRLYNDGNKSTQQLLNVSRTSNRGDEEFNLDLPKALVSANIAFHKLENEEFKDFLEKYTKKIPSPMRLTKVMECEGKAMLQKVKKKLNGQFLYIAETTDSNRRPMCVVLAGSLSSNDDTPSRPYMIDFVNLGTINLACKSLKMPINRA